MKKEFKPDELRQTAEEIRSAIMPKTITPEMVGGTMLGVVDALGEVVEVLGEIPREHVRVKVRGYDGTAGVSGAGATVWLDVFNAKGYPAVAVPRQELTCNDAGVVEFDVPHGYRYAVFSQIDGLGASFQLVEIAAIESRNLDLWNLPIGVHALGYSDICYDGDEEGNGSYYREVPFITATISDDSSEYQSDAEWDINTENDEYSDGYGFLGILVSTADTSFVLTPNSLSKERMTWCKSRDYGTFIPTMSYINNENTDETWEECQNRARTDMDGNINTAKLLDYCIEPTAALFCAGSDYMYSEQRFLPSVGQLYIMWLNRTPINTMMTTFNDTGVLEGFQLLPYTNDKGGWVCPNGHYEYWWSSTVYNASCSWVVDYDGNIRYDYSSSTNDVRAVSAFHFEY